jgi:hypothetical protein
VQKAKGFTATETDIFNVGGVPIAHRPENIVGSIAIYASEQKTNWESPLKNKARYLSNQIAIKRGAVISNDGEDPRTEEELAKALADIEKQIVDDPTIYKVYKCGKVSHIPRGKVIDASGNWAWTEPEVILNPDGETGILRVKRPQEFLDKAVYPVKHAAGLEFGYTSNGASNTSICFNYGTPTYYRRGTVWAGVDGVLDNLKAYMVKSTTAFHAKALLNVKDGSGANSHTQVFAGAEVLVDALDWYTFTAASEALSSANNYLFNAGGNAADLGANESGLLRYDSLFGTVTYEETSTSSSFYTSPESPWGVSVSANWYRYSIFATYSLAGGGGPAKLKTWNGLPVAKIKTINGLLIAKVKTVNGLP